MLLAAGIAAVAMKVQDHRCAGTGLIACWDVQQVGACQSAREERLVDALPWWCRYRLPTTCTADRGCDNRCFWQRYSERQRRRGRTTRGEQSAKCNNDSPRLRRVSSSSVPIFSVESKPREALWGLPEAALCAFLRHVVHQLISPYVPLLDGGGMDC